MSKFFSLDLSDTRLICICYVDRPSIAKIHYAVRRLSKKRGEAAIILAFLEETNVSSAETLSDAAAVQGSFKLVIGAIDEATGSLSPKFSAPKAGVVSESLKAHIEITNLPTIPTWADVTVREDLRSQRPAYIRRLKSQRRADYSKSTVLAPRL
jgi:hypothetical protein